MPSRLPTRVAIATDAKPATSETRVPQMTRDITSRPTLSVPSRWARPGRESAWPRFCSSGSSGARSGAPRATNTAASRTAAPNGARRVRAARRSTTHRCSGAGAGAARRAIAGARSAISDPGIDPAIEEVDEQVAQDEAEGDQENHALHQRVVAREHGVHHEAADAGQGEDVLGDHGAADQRPELQPEHGDDGNQGIFEHVRSEEHTSELQS